MKMICPYRRINEFIDKKESILDSWTPRNPPIFKKHNLHCSYCGSLHPNYFIELLKQGGQLIPTDKNYKAYINYLDKEAKFYFWHLDNKQIGEYIELATMNKLKFGFPGYFYRMPYFILLDRVTPFAFGSIIRLEDKVDEGNKIKFIKPIYNALVNKIKEDPNFIDQINYTVWEEIIAATYDKEGFDEVILTPRSGDNGVDVIAIKKGVGMIKFIDQVKKYNINHLVTAEEVRALLFVLQADEDASNAVLTTTSSFAPRIKEDKYIKKYIDKGLQLVDRDMLISKIIN